MQELTNLNNKLLDF